jgi:hypothetical protein
MALLKRKQEKTTTISIRLPISTKEQMGTLREMADKAGFDLVGSLTDAVIKWIEKVSEELSPHATTRHSNGADTRDRV